MAEWSKKIGGIHEMRESKTIKIANKMKLLLTPFPEEIHASKIHFT